MSNAAFSSCSWVGNATHCSPISATRTPPTGPENGRPESWVEADAALMATTSYRSCGLSDWIVMTTWISLRRPSTKDGRSGRSIRRQVRTASVDGTALAAEERAGDAARGVHPLLDVDRQREEVEVLLRVLRRRGGGQQHGLLVEVGHDAAGGLPGEPAGLEADAALAEVAVVDHGGGLVNSSLAEVGHVETPRYLTGACAPHTGQQGAGSWVPNEAGLRSKSPGFSSPGNHYRGPAICDPRTRQARALCVVFSPI